MSKYVSIIFQTIIIVIVVTITYWVTQEYIVFNTSFLKISFLEPLFYLFPVIIGFSMAILLTNWFNSFNKLLIRMGITFINTYLFLTVLTGTIKYCESEKNLSLTYLIILWLIFLITTVILIRNILPKLDFIDITVISISTIVVFIDFYYYLLSLNFLYYIGWFEKINTT